MAATPQDGTPIYVVGLGSWILQPFGSVAPKSQHALFGSLRSQRCHEHTVAPHSWPCPERDRLVEDSTEDTAEDTAKNTVKDTAETLSFETTSYDTRSKRGQQHNTENGRTT